jgi:hypothetical protein
MTYTNAAVNIVGANHDNLNVKTPYTILGQYHIFKKRAESAISINDVNEKQK